MARKPKTAIVAQTDALGRPEVQRVRCGLLHSLHLKRVPAGSEYEKYVRSARSLRRIMAEQIAGSVGLGQCGAASLNELTVAAEARALGKFFTDQLMVAVVNRDLKMSQELLEIVRKLESIRSGCTKQAYELAANEAKARLLLKQLKAAENEVQGTVEDPDPLAD